ncbi:class III lanthipeptide [Salipaludibacillus sp. CUR1]|nr:class III lanthipeptide [Salipaludibacillus sp. CUR1]MCE7793575.1 class III lanthipeptide [Salipaludibacillus sp. CUR1]
MNSVLELQKFADEADGKGQAVEATWTWTVTTTSGFTSSISNHC